jgi:lysyl-tRNA synthetase class II
VFEVRSAVLKALRAEMDERGFVEVETPMLHPIPGGATARRSSPTTTRSTPTCTCASRRSCTSSG